MNYTLHELKAASGNHGGPRTASQIKYLVIHYTGNDGDNAENNARFYHSNVREASAHYYVDDREVWRSVPDLTVAWAVGGKKYASCAQSGGGSLYGIVNNTNSLSVELCDTERNGAYQASEATLANAVALCVELMDKYNIPLANVCRHFDVTGKLCPAYFVDEGEWKRFKTRLSLRAVDNIPAAYAREAVEWITGAGIMAGGTDGNLMLSQPITRQQFAVMLHRFMKIQ